MFKKYVFWQNILSIHQSAFIRNLAENNQVTLVVEKKFNEERIKQGWTIPDFGKALLIISPDIECINNLLNDKEIIHVFTGIKSFKLASEVFILAIKQKAKIGVILEPFNWIGTKGKLRFMKYLLLRIKYGKNIDFLLVIGKRGRWCYEKTGFDSAKVYDWGYFTENNKLISAGVKIPLNNKPNLVFVGSIDNNKNILNLVSICKNNREIFNDFLIIGSGPLVEELLLLIDNTDFSYLGNVSNLSVKDYILKSDLLVLPSKYDGWGAVVNEALMLGTSVLVSENCGSSVLIDENGNRGAVFSIDKDNLEEVLIGYLKKLSYEDSERNTIINWANKSISGKIAAEYFIQIIENVYSNSKKPIAPWLMKNN